MNKIREKLKRQPAPSGRITNETLSEHRKRILSQGRRFKYPLQYSRHKLVINTVLVSVAALLLVTLFTLWQLYPRQNTGVLAYRVTSIVPLSVAKIDGVAVRYSDYLLRLRSSQHYLEQKEHVSLSGEDGERQLDYLKEQTMQDVIADAYALHVAKQSGLTVSDEELETFLDSQRNVDGTEISERARNAVTQDFYNWSPEEYRHVVRTKLIVRKVAYDMDGEAKRKADTLQQLIAKASGKQTWEDILKAHEDSMNDVTYGVSGLVPKVNQDGGLAAKAASLKEDQVSDLFKSSSDGRNYYAIVRPIDIKDNKVNYEFLLVPLDALQAKLNNLYQDGKVKVYIDVPLRGLEEGGPDDTDQN